MSMTLQFLGTGTSHGIPVIGCDCAVCTSSDPRNRRRRTALHVIAGDTHLLIDTPPDLRESVLEHHIGRVDAVLITHSHADHIFGFDDLRSFYRMHGAPLPVYGAPDTIEVMRRIFSYVEADIPRGASVLRVNFQSIDESFNIGDLRIEPVPVRHGKGMANGFILEYNECRAAYIPDCSGMPESSLGQLIDLDVMILDALRRDPHPTHYSLSESVAMLKRIGARESYITHLCHDLEHQATSEILPDSIHVPTDGLMLNVAG